MKRLGTVRDMQFRFWLRWMTCAAAFGLSLFACMAFLTISEVRSGSTAFADNKIAYEVSRDFTAPSQSLLAAYPFFRRAATAHGSKDFADLRGFLAQSHAQYEAGHAYYLEVMPAGHLRDLVTVESYRNVEEWYSVAEREYLPTMEKEDRDGGENIRIEKLEPLYEKNSALTAEIAALSDQWILDSGVYVDSTVRTRSLQLAAVFVVTLLVLIFLGLMVDARVEAGTLRLQKTLDELQRKNTEVEAFVYIVSHDLRAPLVNLQGFVRELEESCEQLRRLAANGTESPQASPAACYQEMAKILDSDIASALRFISASSTKFDRLIKALLNLSREGRQIYKWTLVDVNELISQTISSVQQQFTESGASICVDSLPQVFVDENSLSQIFSNLISNAIKYRDPNRPLHIEVGGATEGDSVHFWVRDNGLGLPESSKDRIFQAFQRFHPQHADGDGMGLALVHRIAERHGGKVWVESQEAVGSTFHFSVPASPLAAPC